MNSPKLFDLICFHLLGNADLADALVVTYMMADLGKGCAPGPGPWLRVSGTCIFIASPGGSSQSSLKASGHSKNPASGSQ